MAWRLGSNTIESALPAWAGGLCSTGFGVLGTLASGQEAVRLAQPGSWLHCRPHLEQGQLLSTTLSGLDAQRRGEVLFSAPATERGAWREPHQLWLLTMKTFLRMTQLPVAALTWSPLSWRTRRLPLQCPHLTFSTCPWPRPPLLWSPLHHHPATSAILLSLNPTAQTSPSAPSFSVPGHWVPLALSQDLGNEE